MTPKQADFIALYLDTQNASEAYKRAYKSTGKQNTIHRKASELLKHPEVKKELELLQAQVKEQNKVTLDSIVTELEDARQIAKQSGNAAAMVSATLGKAKVLGLIIDKQETKAQVLNHSITVTFDE
jgi:phage terminase small subunit